MRFSTTHKKTFDIDVALHMARLCQIAYSDNLDERYERFRAEGYFPRFFDVTETILLTGCDHDVLLFVGTDEINEWFSNADVRKTGSRLGKVHKGFREALNIVWSDITRHIDNSRPLYITGHSRGAALSVLATARLSQYQVVDLAGTYNFGCPRCGGYTFASRYPAGTFRVVNNNDLVCRIPSPLRFKHVGKQVYLDRNGRIQMRMSSLNILMDRLRGRFSSSLTDGVKDHSVNRYVAALKSNQETRIQNLIGATS